MSEDAKDFCVDGAPFKAWTLRDDRWHVRDCRNYPVATGEDEDAANAIAEALNEAAKTQ